MDGSGQANSPTSASGGAPEPDAGAPARPRAARRAGRRLLGALRGGGPVPWALAGLLASLAVLTFGGSALAQELPPGEEPAGLSRPIITLIALSALAMAPFVLMMTTSFLKFVVVTSILRSALGTQQVPPNQVLMGLALILTVFVMSPVGMEIYEETQDLFEQSVEEGVFSDRGIEILQAAIDRGKEPYIEFLVRHSKAKDRELFVNLSRRLHDDDETFVPNERAFLTLVAAFVTSELTEAFQIGFILFVPFIAIDMIVANVLLAMGMMMLSPVIVSLPIKLLLFVLVDGWHLLMRGLVLGYV